MFKDIITDVFFDLDHTLWDFERNSALTFERIFKQHELEIDLADFLKIYVPLNRDFWKLYREEKITKEELRYQRLRKVFDTLQFSIDDITIDSLSYSYINTLSTFGNCLPYTKEVLAYLKPKYRLHIITNGFHEIQGNKLQNAGISHFFEVVMDSEKATVKKPNPKIFELALKEANVLPENSLMIGDDLEADVLGAMAMGMQAIHLNTLGGDFSHTIKNLNEIKNFL